MKMGVDEPLSKIRNFHLNDVGSARLEVKTKFEEDDSMIEEVGRIVDDQTRLEEDETKLEEDGRIVDDDARLEKDTGHEEVEIGGNVVELEIAQTSHH